MRFTGAPDGGYGSEEAELFADTEKLRDQVEPCEAKEGGGDSTAKPAPTPKQAKAKGAKQRMRAKLGGFANLVLLEKVGMEQPLRKPMQHGTGRYYLFSSWCEVPQ